MATKAEQAAALAAAKEKEAADKSGAASAEQLAADEAATAAAQLAIDEQAAADAATGAKVSIETVVQETEDSLESRFHLWVSHLEAHMGSTGTSLLSGAAEEMRKATAELRKLFDEVKAL